MDREEKIKAKFPNLEEGDVAKVFALTKELRSQGKKVKLEDVAKAISEEVAKKEVNIIKTFASKHGLDYDKIVTTTTKTGDESPLDEKGITTLLAGKKINLFPKDKKKEASPRDVIRGLNFRS
jgi:predicted DNA binding CopG/RHH family protein